MTRRPQFPRSAVSGNIPTSLYAGSPAFNWADNKIFVGDANGNAQLFSQLITDHNTSTVYRQGDFVMQDGDLWRARVDIPASVGFREDEWKRLTTAGGVDKELRAESGLIDGGVVSWDGVSNVLSVEAGTGLIVDRSDNSVVSVKAVSWGAFQITASPTGASIFALWIEDSAASFTSGLSENDLQRKAVRLTTGLWSPANDSIDYIFESTATLSGQTLDAAHDHLQPPSIRSGLSVSEGGGLRLSHSSGSLSGIAINGADYRRDLSSNPSMIMQPVLRQNGRGSPVNEVPVAQFDDGGTLAPVPAGNAVIHLIKVSGSGDFFVEYGQKTYSGVTVAVNSLFEYVERDSFPVIPDDLAATLAAVIVTPEASDFSNPSTARIINSIGSRPFAEQDEQDSSNFYLLNGSRPLSGTMNAAGNKVVNAELNADEGALYRVRTTQSTDPAELSTAIAQHKLFLGGEVLADKIFDHDPSVPYSAQDLVINAGVLYQAKAAVLIGPFDPVDWNQIGSSGSTDDAVVLQPNAVGRNKIDLTGTPDIDGISIVADPSQTAELADLGGAVVDRYGMGRGNFGGQVIRVAQATHGFTAVGQVAAFDNPNWIRADPNNTALSGKALGVVHRIVNDNNVDLQFSGTVTDLDPSAFEGSSVDVGAVYYASTGTSGRLTKTKPPIGTRIDPVLVTTSPTEGVLVIGSGEEETIDTSGTTSFQVTQASHGFTAIGTPVAMNGGQWTPARSNTFETCAVALVEKIIDSDTLILTTGGILPDLSPNAFLGNVAPTAGKLYYCANTGSGRLTEIAPEDGDIFNGVMVATSPTSGVVLMSVAQPSYLKTAGGAVFGSIIQKQGGHGDNALLWQTNNETVADIKAGGSNNLVFTGYDDGQPQTDSSLQHSKANGWFIGNSYSETRALQTKGQIAADYMPYTGGTFTGEVVLGAPNTEVGTTAQSQITFRGTSNGGELKSDRSSTGVTSELFSFKDKNNNVAAYINGRGTTADTAYTVMTREKGDSRYLSSGTTLFQEYSGNLKVYVSNNKSYGGGVISPVSGNGKWRRQGSLMFVSFSIFNWTMSGMSSSNILYFHIVNSNDQFESGGPDRCQFACITNNVAKRNDNVFYSTVNSGEGNEGFTIRQMRSSGNNYSVQVGDCVNGNNYLRTSGTFYV